MVSNAQFKPQQHYLEWGEQHIWEKPIKLD